MCFVARYNRRASGKRKIGEPVRMKRDLSERIESGIVSSTLVKKISSPLEALLNRMFQGTFLRPIKLLLNGTLLGHPLHPVLKDVPVGAWTFTVIFDLAGLLFKVPSFGLAASVTTGVGIAGALGAAAAGLMDWMDVDPPEKSVGAVHAILNVAATLVFAASLYLRWKIGWQLSWTTCIVALSGYLLMTVGATLGGSMVYRMGVMINRNAYRNGPAEFRPAVAAAKLEEGKMLRVEVEGQPILLVKTGDAKSGGKICAIGAVCSHYGAPLNEGTIEDGAVRCPWHGSRFALEDGSVREGPTCTPVPCYEVRVAKDQVEVKMRG
jgi:nitrite reductase/ring-hydroxylating ferredoxin subunit/uncharacterized membrane protein